MNYDPFPGSNRTRGINIKSMAFNIESEIQGFQGPALAKRFLQGREFICVSEPKAFNVDCGR